jgi:hypothetical protein
LLAACVAIVFIVVASKGRTVAVASSSSTATCTTAVGSASAAMLNGSLASALIPEVLHKHTWNVTVRFANDKLFDR